MPALAGQVAIITGASSGIGAATAVRLAREGMNLVLAGRRLNNLEAVRRDIQTRHGTTCRSLAFQTDVTSADDRRRLVGETLAAFGRIDVLVNNAGYGHRGPIELVPLDDIRRNYETNVFALIGLSQLVIPIMRKQGSGKIINVGSVAGKIARPLSAVYDSTKHALEAVSDGMRGELAPFGIKVVLIEPGFIRTEFLRVANEVSTDVWSDPGPYAPFMDKTALNIQQASSLAGQPSQIADVIAKALRARNPRTRYAAPGHARFLVFLRRVLPDRAVDFIIHRQLGLHARRLRPMR
ncbi:MAG: SDR family NAD(P)-dependent oxidoreductase [Acidobacteria bacterium]|nr:SDR family NAD(P)-dependent oxidoreductase [Acidobacteriota bacterium]